MTIPTFAQSRSLHAQPLINETTTKDIQDAKTFDECYIRLHSFIYNVNDIVEPSVKNFLMRYEHVLRFIKMVNKPGIKAELVLEDDHAEAYKLAYDNFVKNNL